MTNSSTPLAIDIQQLVKMFGQIRALDHLDLQVPVGEVHGFLGPNGAGKSTTIRVLLGLLKPNSGDVQLLGGDPWKDVVELHRRLAYVPGDVVLWPGLTGGEAIDLLGNLRGGLDRSRREYLLKRFELDPTKRGRQYSKGNRQKIAIVAALASNVELLILDEPTSGLDPLMEAIFQDEMLKEKKKGRTVLLSSHVMSQVEAVVDRVSIIRNGTIVESGSLEDLQRGARIKITATLTSKPESLSVFQSLQDVQIDNRNRLTASIEPELLNAGIASLSQIQMTGLTVSPPSLEDIFLRQYTTAFSAEAGEPR